MTVEEVMRSIIENIYVCALVGLALALFTVPGCAGDPETQVPTTPQLSATPTAEPTVREETPTPTVQPSSADRAMVATESPGPGTQTPIQEPTQVATPTPASRVYTPAPARFTSAGREALAESAFGHLRELAEDVGSRESATDDELKAAEFLVGRFKELGYSPISQDFETESQAGSVAVIAPEDSVGEDISALPISGSISGEVSGRLQFIGLGKPEDLPSEGLEDNVVLIERGEITFRRKVEEAAGDGAAAAIVFNNEPGPFQGTLGSGRSKIPAVGISRADGEELQKLIADGDVEIAVMVEEASKASQNVIFEVPGKGDGVVILGAHYDTVPDSIGANDNSSGMGVLMAMAEELAGHTFPFILRFIAFGSEETGLHGSRHYVEQLTDEELDDVKAMINLDALGSGNTVRVEGDRWLTRHVSDAADREGFDLTVSRGFRGGGSDHASFRDVGVPAIFFHADDLSRINSSRDTMEHINPDLLGYTAVLVLDLLAYLEDSQRQ